MQVQDLPPNLQTMKGYYVRRYYYHATYAEYLPSILRGGLGGVSHKNWHCSTGDVCLAPDPDEAASYAEVAPEEGLVPSSVENSGIIILRVDTWGLKLEYDPNIDLDSCDRACMIHRDIISPDRLVVYEERERAD